MQDNKSPEMKKFLGNMSQNAFGRKRSDCLEERVCVTCGETATEFKDELSEKEFSISGMCQKCQDEIFG